MRMRKEVFILSIDDILPNRFQPRIKFDEKAILELAESIKKHGVIQPIIVRKIADKYEIIAGERRYKASVIAGRQTIPAIITDVDDKESAEIALIENVQRQDMTPIEEAISYKKILDMGYLNQTELATKLGKTQSTIANKLRLLNLVDEVQEALLEEQISERHARSLLKLEKKDQKNILDRIIKERLTVRKTDQIINEFLNNSNGSDNEQLVKIPQIKEEKGENMNNDFNNMNNNFNIPTGNIIDLNSVQPQNNINPGFMDVDTIENSARDINLVKNESIGPKQPFNPFGNSVQNEVPQIDNQYGQFTTPVQTEMLQKDNQFNPFTAPVQTETPQMDNQYGQFTTPVQNETPQINEPFNPFNIPPQNELNNSLNSTNSFNQNNFSPMPNYPLPEEKELTPLMPDYNEPTVEKPALNIVINKIRQCVNEIEASGYKIELDELDFENNYEITIKIDK